MTDDGKTKQQSLYIHYALIPPSIKILTATPEQSSYSQRNMKDRHLSITAATTPYFLCQRLRGWRNVQYSDNISCKLIQVSTLPCWPEGGEMRTGNYRIASRQEMIEIAENGDI